MRFIIRFSIFFPVLLHALIANGQVPNPDLLEKQWPAYWIAVPGTSQSGYGVYLFRKNITLAAAPAMFIVHVSADNRYKLYVNGKQVSLGPARGDLEHWNYETIDIAAFLHAGDNIIAARVWNESTLRPEGEISLQTGFILQGNDSAEKEINTNAGWKCTTDSSYAPLAVNMPNTYYVAGPGEQINMQIRYAGWKELNYSDAGWRYAREIVRGSPKNIFGGYGTVPYWMLVPSGIPPMQLQGQRLQMIRQSEGITLPAGFPRLKIPVIIPPNTDAEILLDQGWLTNAYPEINFSKGNNGTIRIGYAEALFSNYPSKGNRNEITGKVFMGRRDSILSNGDQNQSFIPLAYRTFRYIQIHIITKNEPLIIEDIHSMTTGYPFRMNAKLYTENPELNKILDIGWRTARLCAMETYMDCPYYEQLQYVGDTRIQSLVSLYNSGDDRLVKQAINAFDHSRRPEGVTYGRHPSYTPQYIPTFSFWFIGMLHDYMMYGSDSNFIKSKLAGERAVLQYFRNYQQADGSLVAVPHWMFTDWVVHTGWVSGRGPVGTDGSSALYDLQLLWAYQLAADMENKIGMPAYAVLYLQYAAQLRRTIRNKYWDGNRNLFADRPEKDFYSQQTNALAILTGTFENNEIAAAGKKIMADSSLAQASIYFKFYLHSALVKAGLGDDYLQWLNIWRENISMGMTTWAEISDINNTRSDCHAWGSSPNIEIFRTVLGIDSDKPGFSKVKIEPHLGSLTNIRGEMPHPRGKIKVDYTLNKDVWNIKIQLPAGITGELIWKQKNIPLHEGINALTDER